MEQARIREVLTSGARLLARGGLLDDQLDGLAAEACAVSGARSAVIYLLDGDQGVLIAGGGAGLDDLAKWPLEPLGVGPRNDSDPAAQAVRARRADIVAVTPQMSATLGGSAAGIAAMGLLPLVTEDAARAQEVEGLLLVGLSEMPVDATATLADLGAIADLSAAAIRAARLEQALLERSDWFDRVAATDPLTGLANRRSFDRVLDIELARAGRQGSALSLLLFDVDGLGRLSAAHGADIGDEVLRRVAATLSGSVRMIDTVARFGGDEFAILAAGSAGGLIAARVAGAIGRLDPIDGSGPISLSTAVVQFPAAGADADALLIAAEGALREAKARGPGNIVVRA
ncbi:MAG: diguanylate cyclase domain-containing protein [Candidatus Limnocylindrales bacterium]